MIHYFEFNDVYVKRERLPSKYAYSTDDSLDYIFRQFYILSDRVFVIFDNTVTELKNRYGPCNVYNITDEEITVLKLKSDMI